MDAARRSHEPSGPADHAPVLREGRTCWRKAHADRVALIVDAADYFAQLRRAMIRAEKQILLIGWDFDTRIRLSFEDEHNDWPHRLGDLINALVKRHPELHVYVLKWDLGVIGALGRGTTPLFMLDWLTDERIHMRLDGVHPVGACHHQKIAVIDDRIAFCGGIDVTVGRWDTRKHLDEDKRRNSPWGFRQPPWHDATAAVDGRAAQALGDLARMRWQHAKDEALTRPAPVDGDPWPPELQPTFRDVEIGIARTQPAHADEAEAREIEALYLAAIASAKRSIYMESQYLASHRVGDALARRLAAPEGPDIVIVNPQSTKGWLEEEVMGSARAVIMARLEQADHGGRLRVFFPQAEGGTPIYVHAKVMIVDDRLLKVGSSNLNNRSMGFDTECELAVEASAGNDDRPDIREGIRRARHELLAEHLGVSPEDVARAEETRGGSLVAAIDSLRKSSGRTLVPLAVPALNDAERLLAEDRLLDPERPRSLPREFAKIGKAGRMLLRHSLARRADASDG